jgi:hypothetical protein
MIVDRCRAICSIVGPVVLGKKDGRPITPYVPDCDWPRIMCSKACLMVVKKGAPVIRHDLTPDELCHV